jgi:hypothetical protein
MKETGFPSPFMDIMMLRPALRTSQMSFCRRASVISTTLPGSPRSAISSLSARNRAACAAASSPEKFDEQDRIRIAANEFGDGLRVRADLARKADHRAVDELDRGRIQPHDVLRALHRGVELREVADAECACGRQR